MSAPRLRPSTILEVAHEAGVSKTSVSRYFGHERDRLSHDMQVRIALAANRLGYRPNPMARSLKAGQSQLIGMLVADIRNPFSVAVMHGVEQACRERGFSLMVGNTDNDPAQERAHLSLLASYRVAGLVINVSGQPSQELQAFAAQGTPLVLLDRLLGEVEADVVGLDNARAIDIAVDHLHEQGYRQLLYLGEPPQQASSRQLRLKHFQHRLSSDPDLDGEAHSLTLQRGENTLYEVLRRFLDKADRPMAVLCANGNVTLEAVRALQRLDTPLGEVGLMGIDELEWCSLVAPGITTLAQPTEAIGRTAVENLMERLNGHSPMPPRRTHYSPQLVPRGSTRQRAS